MKTALLLLAAVCWGTTLLAQDTTCTAKDSVVKPALSLYRDPHKALILGAVIPGAGQFYAGEYLRGYGNFLATVGSIWMGPIVYEMDGCTFALFNSSCNPNPKWPYRVTGAAMIGAAIWGWISSARDAPHAAERANLRHRTSKIRVTPLINPPDEAGRTLAGLSVSW